MKMKFQAFFLGIFILLLNTISAHASNDLGTSNSCERYLKEKNAKSGIEYTTFTRGHNEVPTLIDWTVLVYRDLNDESFINKIPGTISNDPSFFPYIKAGYKVKKLETPLCPECLINLSNQSRGLILVPIYRDNQRSQYPELLSHRFTVKFRDEIFLPTIDSFNQTNGTRIYSKSEVAENIFILEVEARSAVTAIDMAKRYQMYTKLVEFAEPNLVIVIGGRGPVPQ